MPEGDYDWLYDNSRRRPRDEDSGLPPMNLPPPSSQRSQEPPEQRRGPEPRVRTRKKRPIRRTIWIILALWLIFLIAVPIWAWGRIDRVDATPDGERPGEQSGTNFLLVGSDSREGLTAEQRKELTTGNPSGARTDTILILHVGRGPSVLLSVPRDSIVPIPGSGEGKINAAFAHGGPKLLVKTLEQSTGLRIDNYIEMGFGGLAGLVDAVGGAEICPKKDIDDKDSGLSVSKGCQMADGTTALAFARDRHSYANQDLQRVQNQRELIGSVARRIKSPWTVVNPVRYFRTGKEGSESVTIGEDVGPIDLLRFALALSSTMNGNGKNCTMPIADTAVHWDRQRALDLLAHLKNDSTDKIGKSLCTADGMPPG